jgi:UDP-2-acetamido-2,6-beta-L-arabino-hexul-4-ose reductase
MKTVLVTGAAGFIGRNLCVALEQCDNMKVLRYDIDNTLEELVRYVNHSDFIYHLAGVNRPQNTAEFDTGNRGFTEKLLDVLEHLNKRVPLVFTSSTQAVLDNPYGVSKKASEDAIRDWSQRTGSVAYVYRMPNLFGKWSRPNYNSVVATFCYSIARGLPIMIDNPATELNLAYIDDVVEELLCVMDGEGHIAEDGFYGIPRTFKVTLQRLADTLYSFAESRKTLVIPNLEDDFEKCLYATYTSYIPKDDFSYCLEMKHDDRGWLAEFIKSSQFGQIFISRTKPGITRGNHWHHTKIEKFLVIEGDALIKFRKIGSDKIINYEVSGDELQVVDIPVGYTHSITNIGNSDVITLFWADEIFNPDKPDTYYLEV